MRALAMVQEMVGNRLRKSRQCRALQEQEASIAKVMVHLIKMRWSSSTFKIKQPREKGLIMQEQQLLGFLRLIPEEALMPTTN